MAIVRGVCTSEGFFASEYKLLISFLCLLITADTVYAILKSIFNVCIAIRVPASPGKMSSRPHPWIVKVERQFAGII